MSYIIHDIVHCRLTHPVDSQEEAYGPQNVGVNFARHHCQRGMYYVIISLLQLVAVTMSCVCCHGCH